MLTKELVYCKLETAKRSRGSKGLGRGAVILLKPMQIAKGMQM